jgi:hypothetical protein
MGGLAFPDCPAAVDSSDGRSAVCPLGVLQFGEIQVDPGQDLAAGPEAELLLRPDAVQADLLPGPDAAAPPAGMTSLRTQLNQEGRAGMGAIAFFAS